MNILFICYNVYYRQFFFRIRIRTIHDNDELTEGMVGWPE